MPTVLGTLDGLLEHTLLPIASLLEVLHHFVARSVVLGKMGASKTQRET